MRTRSNQRVVGEGTTIVEAKREQVQTGLNLFLDLKNPTQMLALLETIKKMQPSVRAALERLHYVHFARFLPTRDGSTLIVITEFDGELKPYIMDFVAVLGDVFTAILEFVKDAPRLPVNKYPQDFWEFVQKNNVSQVQPWSAYRHSTVLDIKGVRRPLPPKVDDPPPAHLDLEDIQGNILVGYDAKFARHFALQICDAQLARNLIKALLPQTGGSHVQVSTATICDTPPEYMLALGVTWRGLKALGVPEPVLKEFPEAFRRGPAFGDPAKKIDIPTSLGDTGASAPSTWCFGNPDSPADLPDVLLSLLSKQNTELERRTTELRALFASSRLREIPLPYEPAALPGKRAHEHIVHFGYRSSIAQPRIAQAGKLKKADDMQPAAAAGDFLLGKDYVNQYGGNFAGDLPSALCDNGTYAAVRIMKQDVGAFEDFLDLAATRTGVPRDPEAPQAWDMQREWIAAKMMGRWRDGRPLTLAPTPDVKVARKQLNDFDFAPSAAHPTYYDDFDGVRCPMSSHVRRMNPRGALVTGKPHSRRIIRRGMPYGPPFNREQPHDKIERGLFGLFICGDLEMQFEFLLSTWTNKDISTVGIRGMRDPITGAQSEYGGKFVIRTTDEKDPIVLDVPHLVTTRGSDYFFLPGIGGLKYLAS
jgi:deferrochelatase/peroxidase EfeB